MTQDIEKQIEETSERLIYSGLKLDAYIDYFAGTYRSKGRTKDEQKELIDRLEAHLHTLECRESGCPLLADWAETLGGETSDLVS